MQHDRSVKSCVEQIRSQAQEFLDYVNSNNQCAYSDRMVENILKTAEKLDKIYNSNFESVEKKQEENLSDDERWEKEFEKAEKDWLETIPDPSKEIEDMITKWFKVLDSEVTSDNKDWSIKKIDDSVSLSAKIFYKGNEVCDISDSLNGEFTFTPMYDEWNYVAESAAKSYQSNSMMPFACHIANAKNDEDLDLTQQTERGR